jgi:hypothetical protein
MLIMERNVNCAWPAALRYLKDEGRKRGSRNGPVMEAPGPVVTQYQHPQERVLFDTARDANPFFHLFEALWILAGRNDVAWPAQFAGNLVNYSDNGQTFHGAYGYRLRHSEYGDQIERAIQLLDGDPDSRRVVLSLWDGERDLGKQSRDLPCNTHLYIKIREGQLVMTVCNRSNDIVWGLYGANVVQWSMLQEYLAARLNLPMGPLTTMSDSFHAYEDNPTWKAMVKVRVSAAACPYDAGLVAPWPLVDHPASFDIELNQFLNDPSDHLAAMFPRRAPRRNSFFWRVAEPMYRAWKAHKESGDGLAALEETHHDDSEHRRIDWIEAARGWLGRREHARKTTGAARAAGRTGRGGLNGRAPKVRRQLAQAGRR